MSISINRYLKDITYKCRNPFWFMRQAGRYMNSYMKLSKDKNFLKDMCYESEVAKEITMMPINEFNMDCAIIFSDILVILDAIGCDVEFIKGIGPVIQTDKSNILFNNMSDISEFLSPVYDAISLVRRDIENDKSLIGFAGGPWTLMTYMFQDKKNSLVFKELYKDRRKFDEIFNIVINVIVEHLSNQIEAGADVVQIFDSNAGILPDDLYNEYVISPTRRISDIIRKKHKDVSMIGFPRGSQERMLQLYSNNANVDCIGIDYTVSMDWVYENIDIPVQGNLHPQLLAFDIDSAIYESENILDKFHDRRLIFNLGHGVIPETPEKNMKKLCNFLLDH